MIPGLNNAAAAIEPPVLPSQPHQERRSGQRVRSILRVGKIITGERETLCLIRNISSGGMMAHVYCDFIAQERLTVELRNGLVQHGRVAWFKEGRMGIAFDEEIDVLHFLADEQIQRMSKMVPRAPRLRVQGSVVLRAKGESFMVDLHDISQGGAKILMSDMEGPLVNEDAILSVPGLATVAGSVRWRDDGRAGIAFNQLIGFDALAQWLAKA